MENKKKKAVYKKPELTTHDSVKKITKAVSTGSADGDFGQF